MIPQGEILQHHALLIHERRITAILPQADLNGAEWISRTENCSVIELGNQVLIPGLINTHGHTAMSLLRGVADDLALMRWLEGYIWPLENALVNHDFVRDGAQLAIAEMIKCGTTSFADMYFFPDAVAAEAGKAGIRGQLACPILDFPTVWAQSADDYIAKAIELHDEYKHSDLIYSAFGPHAPYTVSDAPLQRIGTLAAEMNIPLHMHVHETAQEVQDSMAQYGQRPLERLESLGLLSPHFLAVHVTQANQADIDMLAHHGCHVLHCPESNQKLASGLCPAQRLLDNNINVALGTDGCASNNDLDMISEMRSAALIGKIAADDAEAISAQSALEMATINAANALSLGKEIGSLEPGKYADVTAVDMNVLNVMPCFDPLSQLVYSSVASQVSHVWCNGKLLMKNRELQTIDEAFLRSTVMQRQQEVITQKNTLAVNVK